MRKLTTEQLSGGFKVLAHTGRSEGARMVLSPGESTGGPDNRHPSSDQWLFVVSGRGRAVVNDTEFDLEAGDLLLIEAGETHEIRNPGESPLQTWNVYAEPVYS